MTEKGGFITVSRRLFEHELFTEKREYSRFEAWLDLIQLCAYEDDNSSIIKGKVIKWGRGQVVASVRYLQQRWYWKSVDKVFSFLELLRSQNMIRTDKEQGIGRITLCKYDDYNQRPNTKRTLLGTPTEHRPNKIKEYNKEELKKEREERARNFYDSLLPHLEKYGKQLLREFYNYWSEWSDRKNKMKWELEDTWEVSKRLVTWSSREDKFKSNKSDRPPIQKSTPSNGKVLKNLGL